MTGVIIQHQLSDIPLEEWNTFHVLNQMQMPFFTKQWHVLWNQVFGAQYKQVFLEVDGVVLAPLLIQGDTTILSGGKEISDYMDMLGPESAKVEAWKQIQEYLAQKGVKQINIDNIPASSLTLTAFRDKAEREDTTPYVDLPKTWGEYVASLDKHNRHELRRKMRNFEATHESIRTYRVENTSANMETMLSLMTLDESKKTFLTPEMLTFFRGLPKAFPQELHIFFLEVNGEEVAATLSFIYNNSLLLYNSGYNSAQYSLAGLYIVAKTIQHAIESGYTTYNFLQGDERYKYDLGGKDFLVYKAKVEL